jgi:NAD+ synthase
MDLNLTQADNEFENGNFNNTKINFDKKAESEILKKKYKFNPEEARDNIVKNIRQFLERNNIKDVVIGISGGKDSAIAAALCARAIGPEHVYGMMLPDGLVNYDDISDSILTCKSLKINARSFNIGPMHECITMFDRVNPDLAKGGRYYDCGYYEVEYSKDSDINVAPRLRMTVLRYVAQSMNAFLCGTSNLSEIAVGYCTKDGDTSCDFNPLGRLTSIEVVQVGMTMPELPEHIVNKTPDDGLSGMSDEEKLGISYKDIHEWIRFGTCGNDDTDMKISHKNLSTRHKFERPTTMNYHS